MKKTLKSSQALDDILNNQRCPFDKLGLGYIGESSSKNDNASNKKKDVRKPERNVDAPSFSKGKDKSQGVNEGSHVPRRNANVVRDARRNNYHQIISRQKGFKSTSRKSPSPRYQSLFIGYFYSCTNF